MGVPYTLTAMAFQNRTDDLRMEWLSLAKHLGKKRLPLEDLSKVLPVGNSIEWSSDLSILRQASSSVERIFGPTTPSGVDLRIMSLQALRMSMMLYNVVLHISQTSSEKSDQEFWSLWGIRRFVGLQDFGGSTSFGVTISSQPPQASKKSSGSFLPTTPPTSCGGSSTSQGSSS